jgi:hypothetical protein
MVNRLERLHRIGRERERCAFEPLSAIALAGFILLVRFRTPPLAVVFGSVAASIGAAAALWA